MAENTIKKTALEIIVDDGSKRVPIKNTAGEEIGVFYFRPTDMGIIKRFSEIKDKLDDILEPLENVDISPEGTAPEDDTAMVNALTVAEERLYEACDYMLGGNMSEAFFGKMNPFSPVNGRFYCEAVLEIVGMFINEQFADENEKVSAKLDKHVEAYKPQDHKRKK